jgi:NitT/TauT family transport system substrate-binding protein
MTTFRIEPHGRLQDWVAEENGYFRDDGLNYEFVSAYYGHTQGYGSILAPAATAPEVTRGAFESYTEGGRACDISSACHWAVNMASTTAHGRMWGRAYAVGNSGVYVPPESAIQRPEELAGVEVGVGLHSGSHFSTVQGLESFLAPEEIKLRFIGQLQDRLAAQLDRKIEAASMFSWGAYLLEQQGFRKILDTTFMQGFLFPTTVNIADVERYFRALRRAQRDIDLEPERYKPYFLREIPERYHALVDVRTFGPGERIVFEPYTQEMYEQTHRWMVASRLFPELEVTPAAYEVAVFA